MTVPAHSASSQQHEPAVKSALANAVCNLVRVVSQAEPSQAKPSQATLLNLGPVLADLQRISEAVLGEVAARL